MHELPVTERILDIVLKHAATHHVSKIVSITLKVGELSDLENEWIQHYFDYLSKDSVADGAKLKIERVPIVLQCNQCSHSIEIKKDQLGETICPKCSGTGNFSIKSGREYYIKEMEAK